MTRKKNKKINFNEKVFHVAKKATAAVLALAIALPQMLMPSISLAKPASTTNPPLSDCCGFDIALVLDSSGSVTDGSGGAPNELSQMKSAINNFVDTLAVTPTHFSVVDFDTEAWVKQEFTVDVALIKTAINSVTSGGATNWEDGLIKAQSTFDPRPDANHQNIIVFASDGNPNKYNPNLGPGHGFYQPALDAAIVQANTIKNSGTRIITLGIGNPIGDEALNPANLKAISSDDAYYNAADFSVLSATLQEIARRLCGGTVTVTKKVGTSDNWVNAADWEFNIGGQAGKLTDANGQTEAVALSSGNYSVIETDKEGYNLVHGACVISNNNQLSVGTFDLANYQIKDIAIGADDIVSCTFYNSPIPAEPVLGCTDQAADNYDPAATRDDGSCVYPVLGCTDAEALNYNSSATQDDGSCVYETIIPGCTDANALNYNDQANQNDGSCQYPPEVISGCTDQAALNYNAQATEDDGSCQYPEGPVCGDGVKAETEECEDGNDQNGDGCSNVCAIEVTKVAGECGPAAKVYPYVYEAEYYQEDRCSSGTIGLQMIAFPNPGQTVEWTCYGENGGADVSCFASRDLAPAPDPILGCVDSAATNYNANATQDDGSCRYPQPSSGGSSSGGGISGDFAPGFGPNAGGGIKPQVAGASIDLDDIARQIDEIRQKIADIAGQIPPAIKGVLGAATQVATGVCDTALPQGGDYGDSWITPDIYAKLRAEFCSPDLVLLPTKN